MKKLRLFLKLYRKRALENAVLFVLFSMLATVIVMVLWVQNNNAVLFQNQILRSGFAEGIDRENVTQSFYFAYRGAENILGMIAIAAIMIGAVGGLCLIGFRNQSGEKSLVMMHIFGMKKSDLLIKAAADAVIYAVLSSCLGAVTGYILFTRFTRNILQDAVEISPVSAQAVTVWIQTLLLITFIVFFGNLLIDLRSVERSAAQVLYQRRGIHEKHTYYLLLAAEFVGIAVYSLSVFHVKAGTLIGAAVVALLVSGILFAVFSLFFGVFTKKRRKHKKIAKVSDLSFCFLCSRNKRDAMLSIVISVGTMLLCLAANILFNVGGILRSAYRDNMGYTILVRADDFSKREEIKAKLDEEKIGYTYGYSNLVDYSVLETMQDTEGMFWAFVIDTQTDENAYFSVPEHGFYAENYFRSMCGLFDGENVTLFGDAAQFLGGIENNQYLSLVSYNILINKADWKLGFDDTWSAVFLVDASVAGEKRIKEKMKGLPCHVESAAGVIDEISGLMSEYLEVLVLVAGMIVLVTIAIFYTVIKSDLAGRRTELYIYKVFGASVKKAQKVIFREYVLVALISSFTVSFTIMVLGELYFYYGIKKHFPVSIPIVAATTGIAVVFVLLSCRIAGYVGAKKTGSEVIRDE